MEARELARLISRELKRTGEPETWDQCMLRIANAVLRQLGREAAHESRRRTRGEK